MPEMRREDYKSRPGEIFSLDAYGKYRRLAKK